MTLFTSYNLGKLTLKNRIVMAPMTRCRALNNVANDMIAEHYAQRSSAGLLITEGTSPSKNGLGYTRIPAIYNEEQMLGWKKVADKVHSHGGKIFIQLMHTGRVSHPANMPAGSTVMAPSAIKLPGQIWTDKLGMQDYAEPKAMTEEDIQNAISEFAHGAELAIKAGIDGIELHGANGYLIEQFMNPKTNQRTDKWGGSAENRMRFVLEVAKACVSKIGGEKVGIRISPYGAFNDMGAFEGVDEFYKTLAIELSKLGLVYIHVVDHSAMGAPAVSPKVKQLIRDHFKGTYILSGGYNRERAELDLLEKRGDLVAFGSSFISNPNLVEKLQKNLPLTAPDQATFYTADEKGYNDYR